MVSFQDDDREVVLRTRRRGECMEWRLVLEAAGIESIVHHYNHVWALSVDGDDFASAMSELQSYRDENTDRRTVDSPANVSLTGALLGVAVYGAIIIGIGLHAWSHTYGFAWEDAGRMESGEVVSGQWWRAVTALTLHADSVHLMSNLAFGGVFGFLVGRVLGGGFGWLAITTGGSLGNLLNAMLRDAHHTSIGASTAVFAALGILVTDALRPASMAAEKPLKRWSPLIGGVLMLALIGVGGERTDVLAHCTGFVAGLVVGWIAGRLPKELIGRGWVQVGAGILAVGLVSLAWAVALVR